MIHLYIEGTLVALLIAACIVGYIFFRLWRSGSTLNCNLQLRLQAMKERYRRVLLASRRRRLPLQATHARYRRSVAASRRRQKQAHLRVRLLQERQRGAIDALASKHSEDLARVEAKRKRAVDEAAPLVGEVHGLRGKVKFL